MAKKTQTNQWLIGQSLWQMSLSSLPPSSSCPIIIDLVLSAANVKHYPPAKQLPWLVLGEDEKTQKRAFFSISDSKHYYMDIPELYGHVCCGSSFGWLFTMDREFHEHLLNPLTQERFELPPFLEYSERSTIEDMKLLQGKERDRMQRNLVPKAILSDNPSESSDFTVVILFGFVHTVVFWRPGDPNWSVIKEGPWSFGGIMDVTYFKGELYAATVAYCLLVVDLAGPHPKMTQFRPPIIGDGMFTEGYLVDFAGKALYLVHRLHADEDNLDWDEYENGDVDYHMPTKELIAFELDVEWGAYHKRGDIDDAAFFVGCGGSLVVVDPSQVRGCVPNHISFSRNGLDHTGFYDMVSETVREYNPSKLLIPRGAPTTWFIPHP